MFTPQTKQKPRKLLNLYQTKYAKGVITSLADSIIPLDGLADLTNAELVQDARPRPRPSLIARAGDLAGTAIIGIGTFVKIVDGLPENWEISMQVVGGVGKICVRKDTDDWDEIGGSYDEAAWAQFCQSNNRVYVSNGVDDMSYFDIDSATIVTGSALADPSAPTAAKTGLTGTTYTYYYKISANNEFGETAASPADSETVGKLRDLWDSSNYVDVSWSAVPGADSYNVYVGDSSGNEYYIATVTGLAYRDDGTAAQNTFRLFPSGNSTTGPTLTFLFNSNGQLFGVGDINNPSYLWYSGQGTNSGDFSPFNGGGYVGINYGGDTVPVHVRAFRDGKGNPAITVLSKGAGNPGKLHHVTFESTTIGDTLIIYPNVYEANGQDGTISKFGVVETNNSLYYPTGDAFKTTGTKPSVINVLTTDDISQQIQPSVANLNRAAMANTVGVAHEGKIFWAVPTGSNTENNEIWIMDLSRRGLWILRWTVAARFMWIYEDNDGNTHLSVLTYDNEILEFSRSADTTDNGVAFRVRVASGAIVFDEGGVSMASIEIVRFKLLYPKGTIQINVYGLGEDGSVEQLANDTFEQTVSNTGWSQWAWAGHNTPTMWSGEVGIVNLYSRSVAVRPIEVDEILNELRWEIITEDTDCDFIHASTHIRGKIIPGLYYGD